MSLVLFEGVAGTGKTTRLLVDAKAYLINNPLEADQRTLGLTKMHGSRKRMEARLKGPKGLNNAVDCLTIDSFAWHLVRRWRGLLRHFGIPVLAGDYAAITAAAGRLLQEMAISEWVARRYPLAIVDELQDCKRGEVETLDGLLRTCNIFCAADAFQDLFNTGENEAVGWARARGSSVPLSQVRRTANADLLYAAAALRNGGSLDLAKHPGFEIKRVETAPMGGGTTSWRILSWSKYGSIAILSPCKHGTSQFVDDLIEWVSTKQAKGREPGDVSGPHRIMWEVAEDDACDELINALGIRGNPTEEIAIMEIANRARAARAWDIEDWASLQRNVAGRVAIPSSEIAAQVTRIVHQRRSTRLANERRRSALTIHQAKNREFESVIVLWPFKIKGEPEGQRRLLYNAITRAKGRAIVIVEDPKKDRLKKPPFSAA